jgi:hypothetical protein
MAGLDDDDKALLNDDSIQDCFDKYLAYAYKDDALHLSDEQHDQLRAAFFNATIIAMEKMKLGMYLVSTQDSRWLFQLLNQWNIEEAAFIKETMSMEGTRH